MKILLVDDDAFLRDMYATKFIENGHSIEVAKTGEEAVQILKEQTFDTVLMDMVMPGMTGLELLAKIKEMKSEQEPKCIVLSNQGSREDVDAATKAGATGYIIKAEMIPSEVVETVEKLSK